MSNEFETQTQTKTEENTLEKTETAIDSVFKEEEIKKIQQEAEGIVEKLTTNDNTELSKVLAQIADLGAKEQTSAGDSLNALKTPVKSLMNGKNDDIPKTLLELRKVVGELDANGIHEKGIKGFFNKLLKKNPLEKYVHKYQSVQSQIEAITKSLLIGKDRLVEETVGLKMLKEEAQSKIYELDKQIYLGMQLSEMLDAEKQKPERRKELASINDALEKILIRTRNMQQSKSILMQSIASIDIIIKNNEKLDEAIRSAYTMTKNVVQVSATIHIALDTQRKTIEAVNGTNSAIEDMILANSKALKENTAETQKLLENPAIKMDALRESFKNVFDAIQMSEESQARIIASSKDFVKEMDIFNQEMKDKISRGNSDSSK